MNFHRDAVGLPLGIQEVASIPSPHCSLPSGSGEPGELDHVIEVLLRQRLNTAHRIENRLAHEPDPTSGGATVDRRQHVGCSNEPLLERGQYCRSAVSVRRRPGGKVDETAFDPGPPWQPDRMDVAITQSGAAMNDKLRQGRWQVGWMVGAVRDRHKDARILEAGEPVQLQGGGAGQRRGFRAREQRDPQAVRAAQGAVVGDVDASGRTLPPARPHRVPDGTAAMDGEGIGSTQDGHAVSQPRTSPRRQARAHLCGSPVDVDGDRVPGNPVAVAAARPGPPSAPDRSPAIPAAGATVSPGPPSSCVRLRGQTGILTLGDSSIGRNSQVSLGSNTGRKIRAKGGVISRLARRIPATIRPATAVAP